jgi:hypothetical protein
MSRIPKTSEEETVDRHSEVYALDCREEVFSETEFPVRRLLGNSQTEGIEGGPSNVKDGYLQKSSPSSAVKPATRPAD